MTIKKQIDGVSYEIQEMPATKRNIILLEIKNIATGMKEGVKDFESEMDYGMMIGGVLDRIDPQRGADLIFEIISNGLMFPRIEKQVDFDAHFTRFYDHQIDLIAAIMELNFGKSIEKIKKKLLETGILTLVSSKGQASQQDLEKQKN